MKTKYKLDVPKIHRNALSVTWSITELTNFGESDCYGHFITNGKALEILDMLVEFDPKLADGLRIYSHYGRCRFCGREVKQDVI